MRCSIKAKCTKENFLDNALLSIECKEKEGFTYGFYLTKKEADEDKKALLDEGIYCEIIDSWLVNGFVTFFELFGKTYK